MSNRSGPYISDEEYLEKLNPGTTRPQDDFLNRPQQSTVAGTVSTGATPTSLSQTATTERASQETPAQQATRTTIDATPPETPQSKISGVTAGLMIAAALALDVIGIIPLVGNITSTVGSVVIFGIWFLVLGVPLVSPRKVASWGISLLAEAIPGLGSVVPGITIGVLLVIFLTRVEEKTGLKLLSTGGIANPTQVVEQLAEGATPGGRLVGKVIQKRSEQTVSQEQQMVDNVRKTT